MDFVLPLRLDTVRDALVEENLERDAAEKQQGRDEEYETGRVLAAHHQAKYADHLKGEKEHGQINSQTEEQRTLLFAFRSVDRLKLARQFRRVLGRFGRLLLLDFRVLRANTAQQRASKALVEEEDPRCEHFEQLTQAEMHLTSYRVRLRIVERVKQIREEVEILAAMANPLHRSMTKQHRWSAITSIFQHVGNASYKSRFPNDVVCLHYSRHFRHIDRY